MQVPSSMLVLLVAASGLWSAAAAAATTHTTLQPYSRCGSSACAHQPSTGSMQLAVQHTACQHAACPVGHSCQQQRNQAWLCLPALEAAAAATAHFPARSYTGKAQQRSLAQAATDNPAVATRTTDTTVAGDPAASAPSANPAVAPRETGDTAPGDATAPGNSAVATRTTDETVLDANSGSATQAGSSSDSPVPLANCTGGQQAVGSQCVDAGSVQSATSAAALCTPCAGCGLWWLASAVLLAVLTLNV